MTELDRLQKKLVELESKGELQQFLEEYQNLPISKVVRKYKMSYIGFYECRKFIQESYGITHKKQIPNIKRAELER